MRRSTGWTAFKIYTGLRADDGTAVIRYMLVPPLPREVQILEVKQVLKSTEYILSIGPADSIVFGHTHIDILTFR